MKSLPQMSDEAGEPAFEHASVRLRRLVEMERLALRREDVDTARTCRRVARQEVLRLSRLLREHGTAVALAYLSGLEVAHVEGLLGEHYLA